MPPSLPGGATATAFAALVDDLTAFLAREAGAAKSGAQGGRRTPAPAPGWAWTADRALRLLQQYAGERGSGRGQ